ncbi:MAG: IS701 family transposase, partial [Flavobacteriaceae bacterium]|nr:IS701 family transposase [Flavobacteriaceae bacterium]
MATGLSSVTDNKMSHDQVTRLLSGQINSSTLWQQVKLLIHEIYCDDGLLIIDDSIESKPFTKTNALINWHYDHCTVKSVKGVNFVSSFYYSPKYIELPVGVHYVLKGQEQIDKQGKVT